MGQRQPSGISLYTILFHFKASLWESIILLCPPPPAKPTRLQYYCTAIAQYTPPHRPPPLYAIHHTILVMAISCKGQIGRRRCCTAAALPLAVGFYTILLVLILYGERCARAPRVNPRPTQRAAGLTQETHRQMTYKRGVGGGRISRNSTAMVSQSCGECRWGRGNNSMIDSCTKA